MFKGWKKKQLKENDKICVTLIFNSVVVYLLHTAHKSLCVRKGYMQLTLPGQDILCRDELLLDDGSPLPKFGLQQTKTLI